MGRTIVPVLKMVIILSNSHRASHKVRGKVPFWNERAMLVAEMIKANAETNPCLIEDIICMLARTLRQFDLPEVLWPKHC